MSVVPTIQVTAGGIVFRYRQTCECGGSAGVLAREDVHGELLIICERCVSQWELLGTAIPGATIDSIRRDDASSAMHP